MPYLHHLQPFVRSLLVLLSAVTLTACPAVEFEGDPAGGGGGKAGTLPGNSSGTTGGNGGTPTSESGGTFMGGNSAVGGVSTGGYSTYTTSGGVAGSSSTAALPRPFETFHLRRGPGYGFCIDLGQAQDVSFTRDTDGTLTLTGTVVHSLKEPGVACPVGTEAFVEAICVAPIPTFQPTLAEQAQLESLIAALPVGQCVVNEDLACDPCSVTSYDINARTESESCCGELRPTAFRSAFSAIAAFVDTLVARAETRHESVRLRRTYGLLGFCAKEGNSVDMRLQRGVDGTFVMAGTYVDRIVADSVGCPSATEPIATAGRKHCIATLASVALTPSETGKLDGLIASLPAGQCNKISGVACDFCSIPTLEFGGATESSTCCGTMDPAEFTNRFGAITTYLDELVGQHSS